MPEGWFNQAHNSDEFVMQNLEIGQEKMVQEKLKILIGLKITHWLFQLTNMTPMTPNHTQGLTQQ